MFNPFDCYWNVGGSQTQVYSSRRNIYVTATADQAFIDWCAQGNRTVPIVSEDELATVLRQRGSPLPDWLLSIKGASFVQPAIGEYAKPQLAAYTALRRYEREVGGITVSGMEIATDRESQALINGAFSFVQADPTRTFQFKTGAGFVTLNAEQITALAVAVATHVQACFAKEAQTAAKIGSGEINTLAAVDAELETT